MRELQENIILRLIQETHIDTKEDFHKMKNEVLAGKNIAKGPTHIALLQHYEQGVRAERFPDEIRIRKILRKRAVRSLSGVSVISLLTQFWGCPGKCIYCPSYEGLPKSYIPNEPAVQRAEMNKFDPFLQVQNRLASLKMTGNAFGKCDVRIIGGTWSVYPQKYQEDFIKNIYDAHTCFDEENEQIYTMQTFGATSEIQENTCELSPTLEIAKQRNETAKNRVIGVAIETRPDWIDEKEIVRLRRYGITRVEIGYQTTHDDINALNHRGHGNAESIHATQLLKDAGFKVVAHMMPGLYGSTPEKDISALQTVFSDELFRPDELKIYPLVVTPHSELEQLWRNGTFEPYDDSTLVPLMAELQAMIPEYIRLNRVYRDIPANEILAGSKMANLRQVTEAVMRANGWTRHDISAREVRAREYQSSDISLEEFSYKASGGVEYFLQMVHPKDRVIFGLCRLRIPSYIFSGESHFIPTLDNAAIIRELHVFGDQMPIHSKHATRGVGQHQGLGRAMMQRAEEIIKQQYPKITKLAVIAGVGVRQYYAKQGYTLEEEYMIKCLSQ